MREHRLLFRTEKGREKFRKTCKARKGDNSRGAALTRMVGAYQQPLLTLCYAYLHDRQLAEDAVQETFLRAYRALDTFRGESSERPWMTAIAVNVCRSMRRICPDDTLFPDGIRNAQGKDFGQWTHEERAQFSARCKPLVDTCLPGIPITPNGIQACFI